MSASDDAVTVYSDYVCPFCYLGRASLYQYLESSEDPPAVEWHPFDLRGYKRGPDGEIRDDVDDGQVRENVARLREEYDVEMREFDELPDVDSWDVQKVAVYVRGSYDEETFHEFNDAVFDAYWQDARDIGDPDVIAEIAASVGVPAEEVRDAIADETLEEELRSRFEAAQEAGVTGVPTFVYDEHGARGAVPPSQLERLIEGV